MHERLAEIAEDEKKKAELETQLNEKGAEVAKLLADYDRHKANLADLIKKQFEVEPWLAVTTNMLSTLSFLSEVSQKKAKSCQEGMDLAMVREYARNR